MTSFSSVQYTSSETPRAFPQVKKQVHLRKDARSSDALHFVCFGEETWNCIHFLVILSLKTLWAGVKRWRTALHRFYVYRNTYFISRDSKMCTLEVLLFCVWCLDNWSRILSGKPLNTFSMTRLKHCNFIWPSHHDLWNSQQWQISISLNRDFDLFLLTRNHLNCHYHQIDFALKQVVPISYYIKGRSPFNGRLYDFW
jgi:hypothetical protein